MITHNACVFVKKKKQQQRQQRQQRNGSVHDSSTPFFHLLFCIQREKKEKNSLSFRFWLEPYHHTHPLINVY